MKGTLSLARIWMTVWFAFCVFGCASAHGQLLRDERDEVDTAGLVIESCVGWDGTVDNGGGTPLAFLVQNFSEDAIEGQAYLTDPSGRYETELGELFIGPGATRRFATIQDLHEWHECFFSLRQGDRVLYRRQLITQTGSSFDESFSYVLLIDDGARKLRLPQEAIPATSMDNEFFIAPPEGRHVVSLTATTWQMPDHFGPLTCLHAVVFGDGFDSKTLNNQQWLALANWVCQGGRVWLPAENAEVLQKLTSLSPLSAAPSGENATSLRTDRMGRGFIHYCERPVLSSDAAELRNTIGEIASQSPKNSVYRQVNSIQVHRRATGQADWNLGVVILFFVTYTILSGLVALFLFRWQRRAMLWYTVSVVTVSGLLATILGAYLRQSYGDVRWVSVTIPGEDGAVQVGRMDLQSSGARGVNVAIRGNHADLQSTGIGYHRWYRWEDRSPFPPYSYQPNQLPGEEGTYGVQASMTPWGTRRMHAISFSEELQPLDWQLELQDVTFRKGNPSETRYYHRSQYTLPDLPKAKGVYTIRNSLPYDLKDCRIVVGATIESTGAKEISQGNSNWERPKWSKEGESLDVYSTRDIGDVLQGQERTGEVDLEFQLMEGRWDGRLAWHDGTMTALKIASYGETTAWLVGRFAESPIIEIDESRTDFVQKEQLHLYLQQIDAESLANADALLNSAGEPSATPEE